MVRHHQRRSWSNCLVARQFLDYFHEITRERQELVTIPLHVLENISCRQCGTLDSGDVELSGWTP